MNTLQQLTKQISLQKNLTIYYFKSVPYDLLSKHDLSLSNLQNDLSTTLTNQKFNMLTLVTADVEKAIN